MDPAVSGFFDDVICANPDLGFNTSDDLVSPTVMAEERPLPRLPFGGRDYGSMSLSVSLFSL